jgi:DNA polymerase-3 subunit alpha
MEFHRPMNKFVHLHVHTEYSLLDGCVRLPDLLRKAGEFGMPAVAISDHGNMYGAVDFLRESKDTGIKPIFGCECYVARRTRHDRVPKIDESPFHLLLLAKGIEGYKNLLKLVTRSNLEGFYYKPRVDRELLSRFSTDLFAMSACLKGEIPSAIMDGDLPRARRLISEYVEIFGKGNFFLELMDHGIPEQKAVNDILVELGKEMGVPLVATNDVHYLESGDSDAHDVLLCVQTQRTLNDEGRMRFSTPEFYLKSPAEMQDLFKDVPEALENTLLIAEKCNVSLPIGNYYLPVFDPPEGKTLAGYLEELCEKGLREKYPEASGTVRERLDTELSIIKGKGLESYFLIVWDFISHARERGIPVGPGRGSAAGSLVAYLLGITQLDPIRHNLIFERFLNPERKSLPDIDTDFCQSRREEVIEYITRRYGKDRVAQIITFGRMKSRAAVRDVGRVMGMALGFVDRVAKAIPQGMKIRDALETAELKDLYEHNEEARKLLDMAIRVEGLARNASIHAAGVVIGKDSLENYVPLERMKRQETVAQFEMTSIEQIGLLKMDILGLRNLTVMADAVRMIEKNYGLKPDLNTIPFDDDRTFDLLREADTTGIFQLESAGIRRYLKELKPESFDDLVAIIALYRPGPLGGGIVDTFIKRRHGKEKVRYYHPALESILKETYGTIVYQEQVMQIANRLAGYTMAQADELRKAMGKKKAELMSVHRDFFCEGCRKNNISQNAATGIFNLMEFFAGYGFNKSHSAAYAVVAYQTAYLKSHYPLEFMAALMTSLMGNTEKMSALIRECRRMNIRLFPPCINKSETTFTVTTEGILFGMGAIKNVGEGALANILEARAAGGEFKSLADFCSRIDLSQVNRKALEFLIRSGALDCLGLNRATLLASMDNAVAYGQRSRKERQSGQISMFSEGSGDRIEDPDSILVKSEELARSETLAMEKKLLGFYVSGHPLQESSQLLKQAVDYQIEELGSSLSGKTVSIGGVIDSVKKIVTRNKQNMAFIQLEDMTGSLEVLVLPKVYEECCDLLAEETQVAVLGKLEVKEKESRSQGKNGEESPEDEETIPSEEIKMIAESVFPLAEARKKLRKNGVNPLRGLHINVTPTRRGSLPSLKDILLKNRGETNVFLHLTNDDRGTTLRLSDEYRVLATPGLTREIEVILGENCTWIDA